MLYKNYIKICNFSRQIPYKKMIILKETTGGFALKKTIFQRGENGTNLKNPTKKEFEK